MSRLWKCISPRCDKSSSSSAWRSVGYIFMRVGPFIHHHWADLGHITAEAAQQTVSIFFFFFWGGHQMELFLYHRLSCLNTEFGF